MTILSVPFTNLSLVAHAAGGAIMRGAGGYIAGTYVDASIVEAFASAGAALQSMGTSAAALATNPYILGTVVIAAVAVGTYCYFHGIPAPVAETLIHAGLGAQTNKGFMISVPKLATALVLLGAAGYLAYRFYRNFKDLRADEATNEAWGRASEASARSEVESSFGADVWTRVGEAVWATKNDVADSLVIIAQEALERAARLAGTVSTGATTAYDTTAKHSGRLAQGTIAALKNLLIRLPRLNLPFRRSN